MGTLMRPGWDAAEIVIPFLHKCLFALLCVLLYTAQHNEGALRTHLLCMAGLNLGLWASVAWCVLFNHAISLSAAGQALPQTILSSRHTQAGLKLKNLFVQPQQPPCHA